MVVASQQDERVVWLNGYEPLKVSPQPAKFGGSKHCNSGDIMIYFVKLSCNTIGTVVLEI